MCTIDDSSKSSWIVNHELVWDKRQSINQSTPCTLSCNLFISLMTKKLNLGGKNVWRHVYIIKRKCRHCTGLWPILRLSPSAGSGHRAITDIVEKTYSTCTGMHKLMIRDTEEHADLEMFFLLTPVLYIFLFLFLFRPPRDLRSADARRQHSWMLFCFHLWWYFLF